MGAQDIMAAQAEAENHMLRETLEILESELTATQWDRERLEEAFSRLDMYLDDRGWTSIGSFGNSYGENGPSLPQLQRSSSLLRELAAMNVWMKRALNLRQGYIFDGGIHYGLPPIVKRTGSGRPPTEEVNARLLRERIANPVNQMYFFGQAAREEREMALFCDSQPFYVGDDETRTLSSVPIGEITADLRNPDKTDEIWAYRHSWSHYPTEEPGNPIERVEWIFRNAFFDKRGTRKSVNYLGEDEPIAVNKRIFGQPVNRAIGWAYGVPDSLGGASWADQYRQVLLEGIKMTKAMAKLLGTVKQGTQRGADNAAARLRSTQDEKVAVIGPNGAMSTLATAGQAYDFSKNIDILAGLAAAVNVSVVALSSNPGTAGGSYGAARTLDVPETKTTRARRQYHIDLDREVLTWMGADFDIDIWFDPIEDEAERYRGDQRIALRMGTGLYTGEETKAMFASSDGKDTITPVPEGWLQPNNEKSLPRKDIDTDGADSQASNGGNFTPTQGSGSQFTGGGSGDQSADDIRQREAIKQMVREAVDHYRLMEGDDS